MAQNTWITLYDVSRDGIGIAPWALLAMWLAGLFAVGVALRAVPFFRWFLALWLAAWTLMGGFGLGNVFYQYVANIRALKSGSCEVVEGPIRNFHPQVAVGHGNHESFEVGGHEFSYSATNLGSGGLRDSNSFRFPLINGIYVRIWHRDGIICRMDTRL